MSLDTNINIIDFVYNQYQPIQVNRVSPDVVRLS